MKTSHEIRYNDASYTLRLEMPDEWDYDNLSGVKVRMNDVAGAELLAAQDATITTITALHSDALAGTRVVSLETMAAALARGDRLRIAASSDGPAEIVEVDYVEATVDYDNVYLLDDMRVSHAASTSVESLWATYDADFSGSVFTKGYQFVITWEPQGTDDLDIKEMATIAGAQFQGTEFWSDLEARYPSTATVVEESRRPRLQQIIEDDYRAVLMSHGLDVDRAVDTPLFQPGLQLFAHYKILTGGGDEWEYEADTAKEEWTLWFEQVRASEIWIDANQDEALDDTETHALDVFFPVQDW